MEKMEKGGTVSKVSCRKRINTDVEKLRDRVSREAAKIIKLKLAQDTAYWDLKEKLQQVEGNHERLQQNMVEAQMQHETISGQYQEELRLRPDTLNKVSSCREISEVLHEYSERCKADQAALCEAYRRPGQIVRDMKTQQHQAEVTSTSVAMALEDEVKTMTEHQNQLVQFLAAFKQQSESEINELKSTVKALQAQEQEMVKANNESINKYAEEINTLKAQAVEKDIQICNLTTELEQCRQEIMTKILNIEELKNAVNNEVNDSEELKRSFEMHKNTVQAAMQELQNWLENKDKELDLKNQKLEKITADVGTKNAALDERDAELETKTEELNIKYKELDSTKTELDTIKKQLEVKDQELVSKDKELDSKANTIAMLMMELKAGTDVRSKLEMDLERLRQETSRERELEREKHNKMAKKIEHLEASVKDKEESVTKQMSIIKEMRHEKERLQEKIQGMQNRADLDDNAVMLTPSKTAVLSSPVKAKRPEFVVPRVEPSLDSLLFDTFSDSSLEGDTLDASEVNRRFHEISRGIPMSPRPIASLKRHRYVSQPSGGLKLKAPASKQGSISLSQAREENIKNKERRFFKNKHDKKPK